MINLYPTDKIEKLNSYMLNFVNDLKYMENILEKLYDWEKREILLGNSIESLNNQIKEWKNNMNSLIEDFKNNIKTLKNVDDRIDSNISIDMTSSESSYEEIWKFFYLEYSKLFTNLHSDINILNNVKNDLSSYENLGIQLGDAINVIDTQINNINKGIENSLKNLNIIIESIKNYSKKILTEDELIEDRNNYLALYSSWGVDAQSFLLYFNANTQINWDPVQDGTNILNHVRRAKLTSQSPIYNESMGGTHYETQSAQFYKYIYYGLDKNNMIKADISNDTYGSSYQDEHGYQRLLNVFYDRSTDHVQKLVDLFDSHGKVYNPGSQTTDKLYIIFSIEEITDFSNINFRGE